MRETKMLSDDHLPHTRRQCPIQGWEGSSYPGFSFAFPLHSHSSNSKCWNLFSLFFSRCLSCPFCEKVRQVKSTTHKQIIFLTKRHHDFYILSPTLYRLLVFWLRKNIFPFVCLNQKHNGQMYMIYRGVFKADHFN